MKRIVVLGSTGSIGTQTLKVIRSQPEELRAVGLSARAADRIIIEQAREFSVEAVALADLPARERVRQELGTKVRIVADAAELVRSTPADVIVAAIAGAAGIAPALAALEAGRTLALANKEALVVGGRLLLDAAARGGARILPVDSEHSAIFQALRAGERSEVESITLTASGGPFRGRKRSDLGQVTPAQALRHPNWSMGELVTVNSATLMNKALEIIEAHWLFGLPPENIHVLIHPESIVHSFVRFVDGSVVAQLGPPDMTIPIQVALAWPRRLPRSASLQPAGLELARLGALHFEEPDRETFPALDLARAVIREGPGAAVAFNAANEEAVAAFLAGGLPFLEIVELVQRVLDGGGDWRAPTELSALLELDTRARRRARELAGVSRGPVPRLGAGSKPPVEVSTEAAALRAG